VSLTNPLWLLVALPAFGVILALHMRRRVRRVVPSLLGWDGPVGQSQPQRQRRLPRPSLPLLLQLLAAALVALALADPVVQVNEGRHLLIAVGVEDAQLAHDAMRVLLQGASPVDHVSVVDVRGGLTPIVLRASPTAALRAAADELRDREALPDWSGVADALGALGDADVSVAALVHADDPGPVAEAFPSPQGLARYAVAPTRPLVAITALGYVSEGVSGAGRLQLQVRSRAPEALPASLRASLEGEPIMERRITVAPNTVTWLDFELPERVLGRIDVDLVDTSGEVVTSAGLDIHRAPPLRVGLLGEPEPLLLDVLRTLSGIELVTVEHANEADLDLVVVAGDYDGGALPQGHRLHWGGVPGDLRVGPVREGPWQVVATGEHALAPPGMAAMFDVDRLSPSRVREGAIVLAWAEGWPVIQATHAAAGVELIVAFPPGDVAASDGRIYLAHLLLALVQWLEPGAGSLVAITCRVDAACTLPERYAAANVVDPTGRSFARVPAAAATDVSAGVAIGTFEPWFVPQRSGWHRLETHDVASRSIWVAEALPASAGIDDAPLADREDLRWLSDVTRHRPIARWAALIAVAAGLVSAFAGGRRDPVARPALRISLGVGGVALVVSALGVMASWSLPTGWVAERWAIVVQPSRFAGAEVPDLPAGAEVVVATAPLQVVRSAADAVTGIVSSSGVTATMASATVAALDWAAALARGYDRGRVGLVADAVHLDELARVQAQLQHVGVDGIDVYTRAQSEQRPSRITSTTVLGRSRMGGTVRVAVTIESAEAYATEMYVARQGAPVAVVPVAVHAGHNTVLIDVPVADDAWLNIRLAAAGGAHEQGVDVAIPSYGATRVAIVADSVAWALLFQQLIEVHGVDVRLVDPREAPRNPQLWRDVDVVVLYDVPAIALDTQQQLALATWVERDGGGVLIAGGERAFGPGGYHLTVLDDLSPLAAEIPMDRPDVAVVFVLDRSGSMVQAVGATTRLEIAREATWEALRLLDPRSQVGIVVFDSNSTLIHPVRPIDDLVTVRRSLDLLTAGGGTALYPALVQAHGALTGVRDVQRHVVVMTDGLTQSGDFDAIMAEYIRDGITVSTVAIGRGASYPRLRLIAEESGGVFYESVDFTLLPSIMAQEVLMLTSDPVRREVFFPAWTRSPGPFREGLDVELPALMGMVRTTAKDDAVIHVVGPEGDAVMASWDVGLGRVMAYASQPVGEWSMGWLQAAELPTMWSQVVRWLAAGSTTARLEPYVRVTSGGLLFDVVARGADGGPATALPLSVAWQSEASGRVQLEEREMGRYVGTLPFSQDPDAVVTVAVEGAGGASSWREIGVPLGGRYESPIGAERDERAGLEALTLALGGRTVETFSSRPRVWSNVPSPQWRPWLLLHLATFLGLLTARYAWRSAAPRDRSS